MRWIAHLELDYHPYIGPVSSSYLPTAIVVALPHASSWMEPDLEPSATRILTRRFQDSLTESLSIQGINNIRSMMVARRTAGQMIISQASGESSRLSISYVRIHKHAKNAEGERQRFRAWYHMNLLREIDHTLACEKLFSQVTNSVSRITWIRKAGTETGGGIIGLIGRPPWFFARRLQRYSQAEKVKICWFRLCWRCGWSSGTASRQPSWTPQPCSGGSQ